MDDRTNNNTLFGLALLFGVGMLAWFGADLLESKAGERVAAFGAVIGGIVGAAGAIFAVYLAITRQRREDMAKVRLALRTEVTTYSKYIIGTLNVCERISTQGLKIPTVDAEYIGKSLVDPVIYPAVADRISLTRRPQAIVEFWMRVAEAKSNLLAIHRKDSRLTQGQADMTYVQPDRAEVVADSLITALQLAHNIIAEDDPPLDEFDTNVQRVVLAAIDEAMASAKTVFPNAESFKAPTP